MLALYHVNHSTVHAAIIELSSCKLLTVEYLVASPSLAGLTLHYMWQRCWDHFDAVYMQRTALE